MLNPSPGSDNQDPTWLNTKKGEILRTTHDLPGEQPYLFAGREFKSSDKRGHFSLMVVFFKETYQYPAYEAVNDAGEVGCEYASLPHPSLILIPASSSIVPASC
jgi:hypothetical protein